MKKVLLSLTVSLTLTVAHGKKQSNIWCFGQQAEIDFNSGIPLFKTNSVIYSYEGCASISDTSGNLLFYTNGEQVWDSSNNVMLNGNGLLGHLSSTQTFILPKPKSLTEYYVATVDFTVGTNGFRYSEIDMTLNNGLGAVTSNKNILLCPQACEKIAVAKNINGTDLWLIVHGWNNSDFYAYSVSNLGINPSPVITSIGAVVSGNVNRTVGYMKVSNKNNRIAIAHRMDIVEIMDFDNSTGQLSNPIRLNNFAVDMIFGEGSPYGIEFSPDDRYLYVSEEIYNGTSHLYQYDLQVGSETQINNSRILIASTGGPNTFGSLQVGPDKKIYVAKSNAQYLGVINYPDLNGASCQFVMQGVYLGGKTSSIGLPVFIHEDVDSSKNNIVFPNIFTPNGDNTNDYYHPIKIENIKNVEISIYDRWGILVFKTDNLYEGWDGKYKGKDCNDGTYYWIIHYSISNGDELNKSGFLQLIR